MSGILTALAQAPEYRVIEANAVADRMLGASIEPILGGELFAVLNRHGGLGALHESIRSAMHSNEACNAHVRFVVDGTVIERQITLEPSREADNPPSIRIRIADGAGDDLPRLDAIVDVISHEMRSPLNAALVWVSLLEIDPTPATIGKASAVIRDSVQTQARLIDDLLEVSAPRRANSLALEAIDLCELVVQSIDDARTSLPPRVTADTIALKEPLIVSGDRARLERAFRHLIRNAASSMREEGGNIGTTLTYDADNVSVTVTDGGIGMTSEQVANTFRSFWRPDRHRNGAGLGLGVVRTIIAQHDGCVCARSGGVGAGSAFTFSLPLRRN